MRYIEKLRPVFEKEMASVYDDANIFGRGKFGEYEHRDVRAAWLGFVIANSISGVHNE